MIPVILFQSVITLGGAWLIGYFIALHHGYSFLSGALVILTSFWLLGWAWSLIFQKKLVALAVGIIVFKYAILGIIIFTLVKLAWFDPLWFSMGVASLILSAITYALKEAKEGSKNVI